MLHAKYSEELKKYEDLIESLVNALLVTNQYDYSIEDKQGQLFLKDVMNLINEE